MAIRETLSNGRSSLFFSKRLNKKFLNTISFSQRITSNGTMWDFLLKSWVKMLKYVEEITFEFPAKRRDVKK